MYSIFAKFKNIESLELYKMVETLKLNVTELLDETVLHGKFEVYNFEYISFVCGKFGAFEISIKKEPD